MFFFLKYRKPITHYSSKRRTTAKDDDEMEKEVTKAKKCKTDEDLPSSSSTTASTESKPSFLNSNVSDKKICKYGEACYRQNNPLHTAEYNHPCKLLLKHRM